MNLSWSLYELNHHKTANKKGLKNVINPMNTPPICYAFQNQIRSSSNQLNNLYMTWMEIIQSHYFKHFIFLAYSLIFGPLPQGEELVKSFSSLITASSSPSLLKWPFLGSANKILFTSSSISRLKSCSNTCTINS